MLDLQFKSNPSANLQHLINPTVAKEPMEAAVILNQGQLPINLTETSKASKNYQLGVINILADQINDSSGRKRILELLVAVANAYSKDNTDEVTVYTEYIAALAYAWGETLLATRAVLRNKPEVDSTLLKDVASKLSSKLDADKYKTMLLEDTRNSRYVYQTQDMSIIFP